MTKVYNINLVPIGKFLTFMVLILSMNYIKIMLILLILKLNY